MFGRAPKILRRELSEMRVASPCRARWDDMEGDEKAGFCRGWRLHVYNLSAMDVEEAAERIARDDDRLCVRSYRRADGTILTRDCPVGVETARQGRRSAVRVIAGTALGLGAAGILLAPGPTMGAMARPAASAIALRSAATTGDVAGLRRLLDAGIDPNLRIAEGATALMRAAELGDVEAVRLLLQRGAKVNLRDREGNSALKLARAAGREEVVAILRSAGARE